MPTTYIPAKDADFNNWFSNFKTLIAASPTTYGLVAGDATAITAQWTAWSAAYTAATDPSTRTTPTVAAKTAARAAAEAVIRPYAVSISQNAGVTDEDKAAVGVTIRKTVPTPVPPPTTTPALVLVAGGHLFHQLRYYDTSTPTTKAKPAGAIGIEIWRSVGTVAATDPSQATYIGTWTKSPNVSSFAPGDVGKVATYWARWSTRGGAGGQSQTGPWSPSLTLAVM
jgi:hypothetical protein